MKKPLFLLVCLIAVGLSAQNPVRTLRVADYAGDTLAVKLTAAQDGCSTQNPCILVIDAFFAKIPNESLPETCTGCTWIDYRTSLPVGTTAGTLAAGNAAGGGAVSSVFGRTGDVTAATSDYAWDQIASKPAVFPPDTHGHAISDTSGLQTALDGKQPSLGFTAENAANKNAASGYAGLSAGSLLTASQIPNNSANTSGTAAALTSTPTFCSTGQAPTGVLANGNATGCTTITSGGSAVASLAADTSGSASNTLVNTGMAFSLAASTAYTLDCNILFTVSATSGVGLTLGVSGPGTPTQVTLMRLMNTTATAFRLDSSAGAAWAAKIGTTATTVTTLSRARLSGTIENGTTAGTMNIQFANIGTTGSTVVKRGSWCRLQ